MVAGFLLSSWLIISPKWCPNGAQLYKTAL
nr:MAG TPA: beta propeller repeat protein [Caudoviricetes sp.]